MLNYYPPITPFANHQIPTGDKHSIYVEECGNPSGVPIIVFHDGPGLGCHELDRGYFDPEHYRIILFDQRGCGRSSPQLELTNNNTQLLIQDVELICDTLGINHCLLFGCGWGATLALAFAQKHPMMTKAMILQGVFLNRTEDANWLYGNHGVNHIYPDYWQELTAVIPSDQQHNLLRTFADIFNGDDEIAKMRAAKAWCAFKAKCATLEVNDAYVKWLQQPSLAMSSAVLECYYLIHNNFLEPNQILNNMNTIYHIPAIIIHGRYDMIYSFNNAWALHKAWPDSILRIIPNSGHNPNEPMITDAIIYATNEMKKWG